MLMDVVIAATVMLTLICMSNFKNGQPTNVICLGILKEEMTLASFN
jgi:hypothetical protein